MNQVKLQVPIDKDVRDGLEKRAKHLGFDSAQAYIRFWAKAEVDGRPISFGEPEIMTPKLERLLGEAEAQIARGEVSPRFDNAEDAIKYLNNL